MGGYILCQTSKAKKPYFIDNISTNIYTLEELCYYLHHNLYLIDQTIINEGLCTWIGEELNLPKLAVRLKPHVGKFASAEDILYPIFKEINYLTYEELRVLNMRLQKYDREDPVVRKKKKGDSLVENGIYVNAIQVYQELLMRKDLEEIQRGLTESLYHNLGCAYSYLFQMEKAMECFWEAYQCAQSELALKHYLLAYRNICTQEEFDNVCENLGISETIKSEVQKALKSFAERPEEPVDMENIAVMLERMTKDYHRSTGS